MPAFAFCAKPHLGNDALSENVTTTAPPVRRKSRLETAAGDFILTSSGFRCAHDGAQNTCVSATSAQVARQPLLYLFERGMGGFGEQRLGCHDHAIRAIPALRGLLGNESGLNWVGFFGCAQPLER